MVAEPQGSRGALDGCDGLTLSFDECTVQVVERRLRVRGELVPIGARAFDLLVALLERPGRLLSKAELLELVWPRAVVEENNLATQISTLRKVLGPHSIATIPGHGYRFAARVASKAEGPRSTDAPPAAAVTRSMKTNLPASLPTLIGREDDLATLEDLCASHRLITLLGAGGVGKTRLAQALLARHALRSDLAHGVCWVEMTQVTSAEALPAALAAALGVTPGAGTPLSALVAALAPLSVFMVLDNAEHLIVQAAAVVTALLQGAPRVRIVVTSQAPLIILHEQIFRVEALALPPADVRLEDATGFGAVALFVSRAQAANPHFRFDRRNLDSVVKICRTLDGLPLALELAAARLPTLGVDGLAASLHSRFRLLSRAVDRSAPARQQTLLAALDWSHSFLSNPEKLVMRRIAVMAGSASLELVQAVVQDSLLELDQWQVLDALAGLVDRSLVQVIGDSVSHEPLRYRQLESPRAYAIARLEEAGEAEATRDRHAVFTTSLCEAAYSQRWSGSIGIDAWHNVMEPELDNVRNAFEWSKTRGDTASAVCVGTTLVRALGRSAHAERLAIAEACVDLLTPNVPLALQVRAWLCFCDVATGSRAQRMQQAAEQALALARKAQGPFEIYCALSHCIGAAARLNNGSQLNEFLHEMRALQDPSWPPQRRAFGADAEYLAGRHHPGRILELARNQMAINRDAGGNEAIAIANLVDAELSAGNARAAALMGETLLNRLQGTRNEHSMAYALINVTAAWLSLGDLVRARTRAVLGWPRGRHYELQAVWADYLALLAALEGRFDDAARLAGYADMRYTRHEDKRQANEDQAYRRALTLAESALGQAVVATLKREGSATSDENVAALAFPGIEYCDPRGGA